MGCLNCKNKVKDSSVEPVTVDTSKIKLKIVKPIRHKDDKDWQASLLKNAEIVREWKAVIQRLLDNKKLHDFALSKSRAEFKTLNELGDFFKECEKQKIANNKKEVAWCIYLWVTHNIAYNTESYFDKSIEDDQSPAGVLKTGKTMCGGYASLFQFLCDYVGIECLNITGYAKGFSYKHGDSFQKKGTDHAWNAIKIDQNWHYVESTWGAGSMGANHTFSKKFTENYFMTPAHIFHDKHYADQSKNVLGDTAPAHSLQDFEKMPMFFPDYHLNSIYCLTTEGQQTITTNKSIFIMEFASTEKLEFLFGVKESFLKINNEVQIFTQNDFKSSEKFNRYAFIIFSPKHLKIKQTKYELEIFGRSINATGSFDYFGNFYITYNSENQKAIEKELETLRVPSYQLSFEPFPEIELLSHNSSLIVFEEDQETKLVFKSVGALSTRVFELIGSEENEIQQSALIQDQFDVGLQLVYFSLPKPYTRYKVNLFGKTSKDSPLKFVTYLNLIRKGNATIERTFPVSYGYNYCRYYVKQPVYSELKVGQMYEFEIVVEKPVKIVFLVVKSSNSWFHLCQDEEDKRVWRINQSFQQPDTVSINFSKYAESDQVSTIYQYQIVS